jgi:hypothetical protein
VIALALGTGALGLHIARAKLRLGSTAATAGHANPVISVAEDTGATVILAIAILAPVLILIVVASIVWWLSRRRRRRAAVA